MVSLFESTSRWEGYLERSKVDDAVNIWMSSEDFIQSLFIADVYFVEDGPFAAEEFDSLVNRISLLRLNQSSSLTSRDVSLALYKESTTMTS
jgi:hypothetical protein